MLSPRRDGGQSKLRLKSWILIDISTVRFKNADRFLWTLTNPVMKYQISFRITVTGFYYPSNDLSQGHKQPILFCVLMFFEVSWAPLTLISLLIDGAVQNFIFLYESHFWNYTRLVRRKSSSWSSLFKLVKNIELEGESKPCYVRDLIYNQRKRGFRVFFRRGRLN